jgi:hypothetical protein
MPLRVMPTVGLAVTVRYLAITVPGVIAEVRDGGRRLIVRADGELIVFTLSPATATFTADAAGSRARLVFDGER